MEVILERQTQKWWNAIWDKMQLTGEVVQAAAKGDMVAVQKHLDAGISVDARSVFQTCLIHIASMNGHAALVELLISRGASVDVLDYGGMRRTPLHWACQQGHVRCVEVLVAAGADVKAQGRSWSKLVQGQSCGKMIDCHSPFPQSPESLCQQQHVKLALLQPEWDPTIHTQFPQRFRDTTKLLVMLAVCPSEKCAFSKLGMHECYKVLKRLAYPISAWT